MRATNFQYCIQNHNVMAATAAIHDGELKVTELGMAAFAAMTDLVVFIWKNRQPAKSAPMRMRGHDVDWARTFLPTLLRQKYVFRLVDLRREVG